MFICALITCSESGQHSRILTVIEHSLASATTTRRCPGERKFQPNEQCNHAICGRLPARMHYSFRRLLRRCLTVVNFCDVRAHRGGNDTLVDSVQSSDSELDRSMEVSKCCVCMLSMTVATTCLMCEYCVQWAGGSYSGHTSWVKAKNAATCSELVAAYWSTGPNDLTHASISNQDQDCSDQDIRTMVPIGARLICLHED